MSSRGIWRGGFWALALTAFVGIALPQVATALRAGTNAPITAFHSTDAYLSACLHTLNGSQIVLDTLASLPAHKPIVVFIPKRDDCGALVSMIVGYLAWPRDVRSVAVDLSQNGTDISQVDAASLEAAMFCGLEPPPAWRAIGIRVAPNLVVVPLNPPKS